MSSSILFDVTDGVAVITLNRPEVRNAFGAGMGAELSEAYRRCDVDDAVRAVVLTGTPPAFCAGADLSTGAATFAKRDEETFSAAALKVSSSCLANVAAPAARSAPAQNAGGVPVSTTARTASSASHCR